MGHGEHSQTSRRLSAFHVGAIIVVVVCGLAILARWKSHPLYVTAVIEVKPAKSGVAPIDAVFAGAELATSNTVIANALQTPGVPRPISVWGQRSPLTRLKQRLRVSAAPATSTITVRLETNADDAGDDTVLLGVVVQKFLSEAASSPDLTLRVIQPPAIH